VVWLAGGPRARAGRSRATGQRAAGRGAEQRPGVTARILGEGRGKFWPVGPGGQRGEAGARACGLSAARAEAGLALSAGRSWAVVWAMRGEDWACVGRDRAARFGLEKGK